MKVSEIRERPYEVIELAEINGSGSSASIRDSKGWWRGLVPFKDEFQITDTDWIKPGMKLTLWGDAFKTRGLAIEDTVIYYLTEAEDEIRFEKLKKIREDEEEVKWQERKQAYFEELAQLPEVFQERFRRFAEHNPDFHKAFGRYEMFCSKEAIKIADHFKTVEAIVEWASRDDCEDLMPTLSKEHSGNTFHMSARFACAYLRGTLDQEHGAMVGLVGCKAYGCHGKPDEM